MGCVYVPSKSGSSCQTTAENNAQSRATACYVIMIFFLTTFLYR